MLRMVNKFTIRLVREMTVKGSKNKLFKGLTEHDILTWEEEKSRYQRKVGSKVTDIDFLRHLLMVASRPNISSKEGVASGYITGSGPIYEKGDTLLQRFRTERTQSENQSRVTVVDKALKPDGPKIKRT